MSIINNTVIDFKWSYIKIVTDFKYYMTTNEFYENCYELLIEFIIEDQFKNQYKTKIRFKEPLKGVFNFGGKLAQIIEFDVRDIRDKGWDDVNFLVQDIEYGEEFHFYCKDIEALSIEKIKYNTY